MQKVDTVPGLLLKFIMIWLLTVTAFWTQVEANTGAGGELRRKIADIVLLRQQLQDRRQQAESALEAILMQQNEITAEAHILAKSLNIRTLEDAQEHLRLHYDIELLRTIAAFRDEFEKKISLSNRK